jgi:deoxyuridine 5'-triphosphate nucleotidohydrolase
MNNELRVPVKKVGPVDVPLPRYQSALAAGMDLQAALTEPVTLRSLERAIVPTGLSFAIPTGWEGQVRPRSGLAAKRGVTVINAPGTVDSDYRGEVKVALVNLSADTVTIERSSRWSASRRSSSLATASRRSISSPSTIRLSAATAATDRRGGSYQRSAQ